MISKMKKHIADTKTGITYTLRGDYQIPLYHVGTSSSKLRYHFI